MTTEAAHLFLMSFFGRTREETSTRRPPNRARAASQPPLSIRRRRCLETRRESSPTHGPLHRRPRIPNQDPFQRPPKMTLGSVYNEIQGSLGNLAQVRLLLFAGKLYESWLISGARRRLGTGRARFRRSATAALPPLPILFPPPGASFSGEGDRQGFGCALGLAGAQRWWLVQALPRPSPRSLRPT